MVVFCSVATAQTLPHARVLATTLRSHNPDARLVVCVLGHHGRGEDFEILTPAGLGTGEVDGSQRGKSSATPETLPARLLDWAFADGAAEVVYLDPRISVYATLEPVVAAARERGVVLVRRLESLPDDDKRPNGADLLAAGPITPGLLAAAGAQGAHFVQWWARGTAQAGAAVRWLDLASHIFPSSVWLDDGGFNVSFWNLHERPLERRGDGIYAGGRPLRLIDFSGFRADRPYLLGDCATRVIPLDDPVLADVCGEYAERLLAAGWRAPEPDLANQPQLGNGMPMDSLLRSLWTEAEAGGQGFGDPSSPLGAEAFAAWLREPAPIGGVAGLNRYLHAVYEIRPDLQEVFPDLDVDAPGLIAWSWEYGRPELGLIPELLPPSPSGLAVSDDAHLTVNVFGYLRDTLGIGEAARLYITAFGAVGVPVTTTAVTPDLPVDPGQAKTITRSGHHAYQDVHAPFEPAFNLVCLNGDHLAAFVRAGGGELLADRITIGNWGWETDVLPPSWLPGFRYVDEIWVYSSFVAKNLGRLSPVPVIVIPQAIEVPEISGVEVDLIDDGQPTFVFMFDFFSTLQRKNPLGLIEAFTRAFAPGEGPRLLLKTINERFRPKQAAELRSKIGARDDIQLVDRYLEPREIAALLAKASCYVSLHRSEGFGLTLAESMALGTPVIATGYSGNMDFTTEHNSYLVNWTPTRVGPEGDVYPPDGRWAEPDLDHAAELMRRVFDNPVLAAQKAAQARLDVERLYAPAAAGRVARSRLETLLELRRSGPRRRSPPSLDAIERELSIDIRRGVPTQRAGVGLVRRAAMRLMLPFTVHERRLDRAVLDALRELHDDLDRERVRGVRARAQLRRLESRLGRTEDLRHEG